MDKTKNKWVKNTAIFMSSQAISIFGSSLVQYAITWHITISTQSGLYATLAIIFGILPTFFLSPFAGVWADRYNRKMLIVLADGGIALCTLLVAIAFLLGQGSIWLLFVALTVRALGAAVQNPCVTAMLPDIVPEARLTRVNGINSSLQSLITLLSPMVSAALLGFAPLQVIFFIDVITAVAAILVLLLFFRLPQRAKVAAQAAGNYFSELKQGFRYVLGQRYLKHFFLLMILFCVLAAPVAFLTPLQVTRGYGGEVWRLSAIEVAFSVGMVLGGVAIASWGGFKNRIHTMVVSGVIVAACTLGLGLPIGFWPYIAVMGVCGIAMPIFNTPAVVMLQEKVDPAYMGRVFGLVTMVNTSMMPIGMLLFGPLADVVAIEWILLATGIAMLAMVVALMFDKALLEAGKQALPAADEPTEERRENNGENGEHGYGAHPARTAGENADS